MARAPARVALARVTGHRPKPESGLPGGYGFIGTRSRPRRSRALHAVGGAWSPVSSGSRARTSGVRVALPFCPCAPGACGCRASSARSWRSAEAATRVTFRATRDVPMPHTLPCSECLRHAACRTGPRPRRGRCTQHEEGPTPTRPCLALCHGLPPAPRPPQTWLATGAGHEPCEGPARLWSGRLAGNTGRAGAVHGSRRVVATGPSGGQSVLSLVCGLPVDLSGCLWDHGLAVALGDSWRGRASDGAGATGSARFPPEGRRPQTGAAAAAGAPQGCRVGVWPGSPRAPPQGPGRAGRLLAVGRSARGRSDFTDGEAGARRRF